MNRVFVSPEQVNNGTILVVDAEAYHLRKVLRLGVGDTIQVADGCGNEYVAIITGIDGHIDARIIEKTPSLPEPSVQTILWQGLPKGDKMDVIVQKCTELGITMVNPIYTERTIVKLDDKKQKNRQERWQRVAFEAAKQCRRGRIPIINPIQPWNKIMSTDTQNQLCIVLAEDERKRGLRTILDQYPETKTIHLLVGPEGGLTPGEVQSAEDRGWIPVTLGPRILRTETAGMAGLTMVLYHTGQLGG